MIDMKIAGTLGAIALIAGATLLHYQSDASAQTRDRPVFTGGANPVDGDTFYLSGGPSKIRLWGFDAPGAHDKNQPESVRAYSGAATRYLKSLTERGVSCGKRRGKSHDRTVHKCWANFTDRDLAAEMVRAGYGVDWPKFSKGEYADEEAEARAARRGLWKTNSESWIK